MQARVAEWMQFEFVRRVCAESDGDPNRFVAGPAIGAELQLSVNLTEHMIDVLEAAQLVQRRTLNGGVAPTRYGAMQIRRALRTPTRPSRHFSPAARLLDQARTAETAHPPHTSRGETSSSYPNS